MSNTQFNPALTQDQGGGPPFGWLSDRGSVSVDGPDAGRFLNDLLTNAVPGPEQAALTSAALLTPQGKILFDLLVHSGNGGYRLDVRIDRSVELVKRLSMYKLRARVTIADISATTGVIIGQAANLIVDPRHPGLPRRRIDVRRMPLPDATTDYHRLRIRLGVPEGGQDYAFNDIFPHEALLDQLQGIDFTKGCYVGQEIVSRMQHRGTARSRFVCVTAPAERTLPAFGTEIRAVGLDGNSLPLGVMGSHQEGRGLALIRLDRLQQAIGTGAGLCAGDTPVQIDRPGFATYAMASSGSPGTAP